MLENRHQPILSILAFSHKPSPGMTWSGEAVEDKFILYRLVPASSSLSLATDLAFKSSSDWFCVGMCGLLDCNNFLPEFLVFI